MYWLGHLAMVFGSRLLRIQFILLSMVTKRMLIENVQSQTTIAFVNNGKVSQGLLLCEGVVTIKANEMTRME